MTNRFNTKKDRQKPILLFCELWLSLQSDTCLTRYNGFSKNSDHAAKPVGAGVCDGGWALTRGVEMGGANGAVKGTTDAAGLGEWGVLAVVVGVEVEE